MQSSQVHHDWRLAFHGIGGIAVGHKVNLAISTRTKTKGVEHLGIQLEETSELAELTDRLKRADLKIFSEGETTCCYAESKKAWVQDPTGLPWETYHTMADAEAFSESEKKKDSQLAVCPHQL
ncbi:MAG: hypothetical protein C5B49_05770 [Bdellovibrio sp.]|nr:MAG: hypothetical protein C5B49_05770 [Bdellovibrio sp.]